MLNWDFRFKSVILSQDQSIVETWLRITLMAEENTFLYFKMWIIYMSESKLRTDETGTGTVLTYSSLGSACGQKALGPAGDLLHQRQLHTEMKFSCLQRRALIISDPAMVFCQQSSLVLLGTQHISVKLLYEINIQRKCQSKSSRTHYYEHQMYEMDLKIIKLLHK